MVKANVWLDNACDFYAFNMVHAKYFLDHPPSRSAMVSPIVRDGTVEMEVVACKLQP